MFKRWTSLQTEVHVVLVVENRVPIKGKFGQLLGFSQSLDVVEFFYSIV
jgi:hypothetical protein